ncbi:N-acetyl sugar amidotransferase [Gammaproteobacteria bacterium]|nr:N-acetyl sugar amidotransferase [Gammaproteobacteria bacterium]
MQYCTRCLNPANHALNITFDVNGICSGCLVHQEKYEIDWTKKEKDLASLLDHFASRAGSSYDCIIPVSGTGDDFFVTDMIKNKYNLNPLLVTYNTHFNTKIGTRNLARLITELDCDHLFSTVGPDTVKEITRVTLKKFGDMYWHVLAGSQTFPVQIATKLNIPLIIWGVNGWLDQVGMFSHHDNVEMTKKVRKEHALRGFDAQDLAGLSNKLSDNDLQAFTYPSDAQLERSRVRGLYLGNYIFWDSKSQVESMIDKYGYETIEQDRTYNTYESIGCWNNAGIHDYIKFLKYGYGKVTDHASRDIRLRRLTRLDGIKLVSKFQSAKPQNLDLFLNWLSMSEEQFFELIDKFRDPQIWRIDQNKSWKLIDSVINHLDENPEQALTQDSNCEYQLTELLEREDKEEGYILLGRSYMDENNFKATEG